MASTSTMHSPYLNAADSSDSSRTGTRNIPETPAKKPESSCNNEEGLLGVYFNQDFGCFACGTDQGFRIYNCDPFEETFKRVFRGGIRIVEMLFRCNILALVGGGKTPFYSPNKVMIWDDNQKRGIGELTFRSDVRAVKMRRDRIVVVLEHKIYVYDFKKLKLLHQIETLANPKGLCVVSQTSSSFVLACPGLHRGQVRVEHYGLNTTKLIAAHDSHIACLALTMDGLILATASTKGTLVRIFNTIDGTRLQEVRRGADRAEVYSIALSPTAQWLAVSSDKGTIHIFGLKVQVAEAPSSFNATTEAIVSSDLPYVLVDSHFASHSGTNTSSSLSFMKGVLPKYFSSEWSFAQFHLSEHTRFLVSFSRQNTLIVVGFDGSYYKCAFDPSNGGEMIQQEYVRYMNAANC
eukprot:TRINITY_DN1844_c0_g1_i1.p1 TRINITY_DN1844_c0_g1~~TRINITY_DN1844_c0_g1_i1.p1  ORF type:complete len:407 (-),score=48.08 TRINITY_DN1844_c0_g1_i1:220-1440(-)